MLTLEPAGSTLPLGVLVLVAVTRRPLVHICQVIVQLIPHTSIARPGDQQTVMDAPRISGFHIPRALGTVGPLPTSLPCRQGLGSRSGLTSCNVFDTLFGDISMTFMIRAGVPRNIAYEWLIDSGLYGRTQVCTVRVVRRRKMQVRLPSHCPGMWRGVFLERFHVRYRVPTSTKPNLDGDLAW